MKLKRSKATDISHKVKKIVWERDNHCCIICGFNQAMPNAHYISRAQGGLGVEKNIVTLCQKCHNKYDNTAQRPMYKKIIKAYLQNRYENWNEEDLYYKK